MFLAQRELLCGLSKIFRGLLWEWPQLFFFKWKDPLVIPCLKEHKKILSKWGSIKVQNSRNWQLALMPIDLPETRYLRVFCYEKNEFALDFFFKKKPEYFKMAPGYNSKDRKLATLIFSKSTVKFFSFVPIYHQKSSFG